MDLMRTLAVAVSLLAHAGFGYQLVERKYEPSTIAYNQGEGEDSVTVEQGIAIEGLAKLGEAMETIETAEVTPVDTVKPPPVDEVKPREELADAITSQASTVEDNIVKTEEPPPPEVVETKPPEEVQPQEQPQQVAIVSEQSSGQAREAGDATARNAYLGRLRDVLERAKVNPRSRLAGTVVVKFKIGTDGQLIWREISTSSGSKVLDEAALAALDRAAPFPTMPVEVADDSLVVSVPFKFITR